MRNTNPLNLIECRQALGAFLQRHAAHAWWFEPKTSPDEPVEGAGFASTSVQALLGELPAFDELWVWAPHGAAFHAVLSSAGEKAEVLWQRFDGSPSGACAPLDVRQLSASDRHRFGLNAGDCPDAWRLRHHDESGYLWLEPSVGES